MKERVALARKSTRATAARDRARERANRFLEREQRLLEIAEQFEQVRGELDGLSEATDAKIAKIREQAEARIAEARERAAEEASDAKDRATQLQQQMLSEGVTRKEVGERLGIPTREVVREQQQ